MNLTIITINLNNASGLEKTMQSVASQVWGDFEFVVVDGASTDGSLDIIQGFCPLFGDRLRWVSEPDNGIYNAMNKGIQMSSGKYLLFLNSGDWLVDSMVLKDINCDAFSAEIVVGKCNVVEGEKVVWTYIPYECYTFGKIYMYGIAHQSSFIQKAVFERFGLYDETYKYNADTEFWYRTIIDNKVSTQALDRVISNYSLGGLSDVLKGNAAFLEEHNQILSNPSYEKFLPDYQEWKRDRQWIAKNGFIDKYPIVIRLLGFIERIKCNLKKV